MYTRQQYARGRLVDFVLLLQVNEGTHWTDIARVDSYHGGEHGHGISTCDGDRSYTVIHMTTSRYDIEDSLERSLDYFEAHAVEIERAGRNEHHQRESPRRPGHKNRESNRPQSA